MQHFWATGDSQWVSPRLGGASLAVVAVSAVTGIDWALAVAGSLHSEPAAASPNYRKKGCGGWARTLRPLALEGACAQLQLS